MDTLFCSAERCGMDTLICAAAPLDLDSFICSAEITGMVTFASDASHGGIDTDNQHSQGSRHRHPLQLRLQRSVYEFGMFLMFADVYLRLPLF